VPPVQLNAGLQLLSTVSEPKRHGKFRSSDAITSRAPLTELNRVIRRLMNRAGDIKTAIIP
jgi:hypothetical protein